MEIHIPKLVRFLDYLSNGRYARIVRTKKSLRKRIFSTRKRLLFLRIHFISSDARAADIRPCMSNGMGFSCECFVFRVLFSIASLHSCSASLHVLYCGTSNMRASENATSFGTYLARNGKAAANLVIVMSFASLRGAMYEA